MGLPAKHFFLSQRTIGRSLLKSASVVIAVFALAGCASQPMAKPAAASSGSSFADEVAAEQAVLETKGESTNDAKIDATRSVTQAHAAAERLHVFAQVKPLAKALANMEGSHGSWEYDATTTTVTGGKTTVMVEHFDPSQPDETLWTLVSVDGKAPNEEAQASYRRLRLATWKRLLAARPRRPDSARIADRAFLETFTVTPLPDKTEEFAFVTVPSKAPPIMTSGQFRDAYVLDPGTGRLVRQDTLLLYRVRVIGGLVVDEFEAAAAFGEFGVGRFPLVAKTRSRIKAHIQAANLGETEVDVDYSGYHAVKPYQDRPMMRIGVPRLVDLIPGVF